MAYKILCGVYDLCIETFQLIDYNASKVKSDPNYEFRGVSNWQ
jgi:hypothetical protein